MLADPYRELGRETCACLVPWRSGKCSDVSEIADCGSYTTWQSLADTDAKRKLSVVIHGSPPARERNPEENFLKSVLLPQASLAESLDRRRKKYKAAFISCPK